MEYAWRLQSNSSVPGLPPGVLHAAWGEPVGAAAGLLCLLSPMDWTSRKVTAALSRATTLLLLVRLRRRRGSTLPLPRIWAGSMLGGLEAASRSWAFSLAAGWVCHTADADP